MYMLNTYYICVFKKIISKLTYLKLRLTSKMKHCMSVINFNTNKNREKLIIMLILYYFGHFTLLSCMWVVSDALPTSQRCVILSP